KSEFVSIASHELLTPTSTIQGYLSMILDEGMGKVDPKAREYLERVRVTSKRLTELVQDLLNVSRIESGRIKVNPQPLNLLETLRQVVEELTPQARDKGLALHLEDPSRIESKVITVFADPERVRQVLVNIIGNAVKYTPKGGVTVSIERLPRAVRVNVTDTGVGMSPEERKHLFEKFYRVQNEATRGISGTGLGLYITKNIIELMGGTITVESTAGKGSTFSFTLPVTETKHLVKNPSEPPSMVQSLPPSASPPPVTLKTKAGVGGIK
ncbi:MAG TPA: HAMP domain-containing sensor histidine kinase, partial [Anaerolineales bacterium]